MSAGTKVGGRAARSSVDRLSLSWLALPGTVFLLIFFVVPVARILGLSFQDATTGGLTPEHYSRMAHSSLYLRVLGTTYWLAFGTAVGSVVLGYPLAYWIARQPSDRRAYLLFLVLIPFWTSYLIKSFSWILILGQFGILNKIFMGLGLTSAPVELLRSNASVIVGMVHSLLPLAVMTMLPTMEAIDKRLPLAAQTLGAHPSKAFWLVFFPLSMPGVAAAGLLVFVFSLGFFIVPALLGGPQQTGLAQMIISQIQEVLNWNFASALSGVLLITALITCFLFDRVFGMSSVTGTSRRRGSGGGNLAAAGRTMLKAIASATSVLPKTRITSLLLPAYSTLALAFLIVPTLVIVPISFTESTFLDFPPVGFSLRWFEEYAASPVWLGATVRSFIVALATGLLATLIGGLTALAFSRSQSKLKGAVFGLFLAPLIVPRIVVALGLFYLYAQLGLVATNIGLVIGHVVLALPFTFVSMLSVLKGYDRRLDEAAQTLGANRIKTMRYVTAPILKGGILAAFVFAFITSLDELTVAIFVSGGIQTTLPKQMWDDVTLQLKPTLAAVSVVMLLSVTALITLGEFFRRRSFKQALRD